MAERTYDVAVHVTHYDDSGAASVTVSMRYESEAFALLLDLTDAEGRPRGVLREETVSMVRQALRFML